MKKINAMVLLICISCSACHSGRHALKNYFQLLVDKKPLRAEKYLSESCKNKLLKVSPTTDMSKIIQGTLLDGLQSYEIGEAQTIGDTVFVRVKFILNDGMVFNLDKNQEVSYADGKKAILDYRYRVNKEGKQWKVNIPYCLNTK